MKKSKYSFSLRPFSVILLVFAALSFSCATSRTVRKSSANQIENLLESELLPAEIKWQDVCTGIEQTDFHIPSIKVSWHCVKIDLNNTELSVTGTPKTKKTKASYTEQFAKEENAVIAINTTPYDVVKKTYTPVGAVKIDGELIFPPNSRYSALGLYFTNESTIRAQIIESQTPESIQPFDYCFGGFYTILKDDEIIPYLRTRHSRIGAGISDDGRYLYILAATPDFNLKDNNGLTYEECAVIFKALGCTDALQFDGGHSTSLTINGKKIKAAMFRHKVPVMMGFTINSCF